LGIGVKVDNKVGEWILKTKICSKCGIEKPITEYHKNGFDNKGIQKYRGYCKKCANKQEMERYWAKREFIDSQRTSCEKCGESRSYVLDFHHKNSSDKDFTIGQLRKGSLDIIQAEIDKCVCLCANCHREFHYLEKTGLKLEEYLA
jgi:hypothetical protein